MKYLYWIAYYFFRAVAAVVYFGSFRRRRLAYVCYPRFSIFLMKRSTISDEFSGRRLWWEKC